MALEDKVSLPLSIITLIDLSRVQRELGELDEFLLQSSIRKPGTPMSLPRLSKLLDDMAASNGVNLLEEDERRALVSAVDTIKNDAPRIHISFSAEPSAHFVNKIASFMRVQISPIVLLQIGLQPTIAAGCIIRTPNKQLDFSLRHRLKNSRSVLAELLHASLMPTAPGTSGAPVAQPTAQPVGVVK